MEIGHDPKSGRRGKSASTLLALLIVLVLLAPACAVADRRAHDNTGDSGLAQPPSAAGFAGLLVDSTTAYQKANGISAHLANVDCVRASSLEYMCSYAITSPNRSAACYLMQARWTPAIHFLYTVTLSGRVRECGTLHAALRSLP